MADPSNVDDSLQQLSTHIEASKEARSEISTRLRELADAWDSDSEPKPLRRALLAILLHLELRPK